jgi:dihydrofolate reductase
MRTVIYGAAVSLDGFLAGADGALDWLYFSKDVQRIMADFWKGVDTVLMGRKTYLASVGAHAEAPEKTKKSSKPVSAPIRTYVFSRTLERVSDPNVELIRGDVTDFTRRIKQEPGGGICLMGGGELAQALLAAGLVDRIGLNIHPVLLSAGIPTFRGAGKRVKLRLTECRPIEGGCVLANYDVLHSEPGRPL